jgi:cytochrome c
MMSALRRAALILWAVPVVAQDAPTGDAANGAVLFARQCTTCHLIADADGQVLAGRAARTGPNLFGLAGRPVASIAGFAYGDSLELVGETGLIWDEAAFVAYAQDPTDWLRAVLADRRARSKMAFRVRSEAEARDLYAYLATFPAASE